MGDPIATGQNPPLDQNNPSLSFGGSWTSESPLTATMQSSYRLLKPGVQSRDPGQSESRLEPANPQQPILENTASLNSVNHGSEMGMSWSPANQGGSAAAVNELQPWLYPLDRDLLSSLHTYTTSPLLTPYFNAIPAQNPFGGSNDITAGETSCIRSVPRERFSRVEGCWNAQQYGSVRLQPTLWKDVIFYPMENLFSNGSASKLDSTEGSSGGFDVECQYRLEETFGLNTIEPNGHTAVSTLPTSQGVHQRIQFPPTTILDIALGLFFRRFHPSLPFIHMPTFCVKTTPVAFLLAICLNGLSILGTTGAMDFVARMYPIMLRHTFTQLTSSSERPTSALDKLTTIATAVLTINLAMSISDENYIAQCQMLYTALLAIVQTHGLLSSAGNYDVADQLADIPEPEARWKAWSRVESTKRLICALSLMDSLYANHLADCPVIRSEKIHFFVPCDETLFQAKSAAEWERLSQQKPNSICSIRCDHLEFDLSSFGTLASLSVVQIQILELYHRFIRDNERITRLVPWREYQVDLKIANILKVAMIGTKPSTPLIQKFDINCMIWWHSLCIMLLVNCHILDLAAGRHGPGPASAALDQVAKWSRTVDARRACVHAAQSYRLMSTRRVSEIITMHSVSALFVSALALGLYVFTADQSGPTVELTSANVDWQDVAKVGMTEETTSTSSDDAMLRRRENPSSSPIAAFIQNGGVVSLSGITRHGGYESSRRVLLDFATLMDGIGERKSRTFSQILHIMSDDLMNVENVK